MSVKSAGTCDIQKACMYDGIGWMKKGPEVSATDIYAKCATGFSCVCKEWITRVWPARKNAFYVLSLSLSFSPFYAFAILLCHFPLSATKVNQETIKFVFFFFGDDWKLISFFLSSSSQLLLRGWLKSSKGLRTQLTLLARSRSSDVGNPYPTATHRKPISDRLSLSTSKACEHPA